MTTSLQYQQAIRRALGLSGTDTSALPQTDVLEALNAALQAISTEQEWLWQFASTTGSLTLDTQTLALPTGYIRSSSFSIVFDDDERVLVQRLNFADFEGKDETPAEPIYFARQADSLYFWPIPDSAYTFRHFYYKNEPVLTADGDVPLLPDQFSRWLVVEGAGRLYLRTVSPDKYNELRTEAAEWRARAVRYNFRNKIPLPDITLTKDSVWQDY